MAYDVAAIKEQTDLLALASKTTSLKKVANTTKRGPEYAGECPRCGDGSGYDPFRVQPDAPGGGAFFCRHCHDKWGDVIEFVMWYDGVDFGRACAILGGQNMPQTGQESAKWGRYAAIPGLQRPQEAPRAAPASDKAATRPPVARTEAPSALWQEKARTFAADCQAQLWETPKALAYLRERGLSDATIKAAGLGWHDKDQYRDPAEWGQRGARLWLPKGWTIPCESGGVLWYVKVRRPKGDPRYWAIKGSKKQGVVYGLDGAKGHVDVILAEGELNGLTLGQELAGVAAVVSVGDAGNAPGSATLAILATIPRWWAAFDPDAAGEKGAAKLGAFSDRVTALAWPWGDLDINDAHMAGHDLAAWAVPQIGPRDADKRLAWARHWLGHLDAAAGDAGADDKDPSLRVWLAMLGEHDGMRAAK